MGSMTNGDPRDGREVSEGNTELSEVFHKSAEVISYEPEDHFEQPPMMTMDLASPDED